MEERFWDSVCQLIDVSDIMTDLQADAYIFAYF